MEVKGEATWGHRDVRAGAVRSRGRSSTVGGTEGGRGSESGGNELVSGSECPTVRRCVWSVVHVVH